MTASAFFRRIMMAFGVLAALAVATPQIPGAPGVVSEAMAGKRHGKVGAGVYGRKHYRNHHRKHYRHHSRNRYKGYGYRNHAYVKRRGHYRGHRRGYRKDVILGGRTHRAYGHYRGYRNHHYRHRKHPRHHAYYPRPHRHPNTGVRFDYGQGGYGYGNGYGYRGSDVIVYDNVRETIVNNDYDGAGSGIVYRRKAPPCPSRHNCGYRVYEDGSGPRIITPGVSSVEVGVDYDGVVGPTIITLGD